MNVSASELMGKALGFGLFVNSDCCGGSVDFFSCLLLKEASEMSRNIFY